MTSGTRIWAEAEPRVKGKTAEAKSLIESAAGLKTLSIADEARKLAFYSTDGGGEHFKSIWADLRGL